MEKSTFLKNILGQKTEIHSQLAGGMMNESFIVADDNKKYVAYFPPEAVKGMVDRKLEKFHQDICYKNSLSSKSVYFDIESGIKINEFIEGSSLNLIKEYDIKKVASLLKKFHNLKPLSGVKYSPFERLEGYEKEACSFQKLSNNYAMLKSLLINNKDFLSSDELVISHNDAQKSNIIKSLNNEYYLIDFEFAADNDEVYDIATFGNNSVKEGHDLLVEYFNGAPTNEQEKKYYLWRIYISLQWHLVAISKHHKGEGKLHNFNFLEVADFFMNNALEAFENYKNI